MKKEIKNLGRYREENHGSYIRRIPRTTEEIVDKLDEVIGDLNYRFISKQQLKDTLNKIYNVQYESSEDAFRGLFNALMDLCCDYEESEEQ